ncbi:hypothetical protein FisN_26Hu024 [Fistulifera solaris]|uniref:IGFBP N-terminal domain-containing protein n=1 Tax=Fistulifera solaris TaxID=1519565 RepID=A0A1Z5JXJ9_FISSO|nr:hypothetical protein FisN_26Hu024 [Fistulifera solaris]|eukprot:GAX18734.1 hypothetical protein FisN_26Hu024 [Fistulifera solaris]
MRVVSFGAILLFATSAYARLAQRELQGACPRCRSGSPGTQCQASPGATCFNLNSQGKCPAGTFPCPGVVESGPRCQDLGKNVVDKECTPAQPICVHPRGGVVSNSGFGDHCATCINSRFGASPGQVTPDEGCTNEFRICVGKNGNTTLAGNTEGFACAVCTNSIANAVHPGNMDEGCPPFAPMCVDATGKDPAHKAVGTKCVAKCVDTKRTGSGTDRGCSTAFPICVLANGSDPGPDNAGVKCAKEEPRI